MQIKVQGVNQKEAKNLWLAGEWQHLAELDQATIAQHSDRARLALLMVSANQQLGLHDEARHWAEKALAWGASVEALLWMLISGVHNTLGRVAALIEDSEKSKAHFTSAIGVIDQHDIELMVHTRRTREMARLGLLTEAFCEFNNLLNKRVNTQAQHHILITEAEVISEKIRQIQLKQAQYGYEKSVSSKPPPLVQKSSDTKGNYYGLNKLDKKLEVYLDFDNGFFVEIGANDGIAQSNTKYFEETRSWRGVLIEPVLHNYLKCKKNRSPQNYFEHAACVSFGYSKEYVRLHYANLMTISDDLESDIQDPIAHAELGKIHKQVDEPVEILAVAKTMQQILVDSRAPKLIDFFSLDVEGAEIEVLKGVNFDDYSFRYILVECWDFDKVRDYLSSKGYILEQKMSRHDYLFKMNTCF